MTAVCASPQLSEDPSTVAPAPRSRRGTRIAGYTLLGTSAGSVVLVTLGVLRARNASSDLNALCGPAAGVPEGRCPDSPEVSDRIDDRRGGRALAIAGMALGGAALGTGLVLVLTGSNEANEERPVSAAAGCAPGGCSAHLRVRF